jgi:transposase-like protein
MNPSVPTFDARQAKGEAIAHEFGWVQRVDEHSYRVRSQSKDTEYEVMSTEVGWVCNCPDSVYRGLKCKHVWAVEVSWTLRNVVRETFVIEPVSVSACAFCRSPNFKKFGIRRNKAGSIQRFVCSDCRRTFSVNLGFKGMRASPQAITSAMQLYFTGESLRNVQKFLRLQGVSVSHVCIYNWIRKYVGLMDRYLQRLTPSVGDTWRTDALFLKVKGNLKYLFAMMDDETRFWIAQQIADNKATSDVRPMFREAMAVTGKRPKVLISDGAHNFHQAYNKEFWTHYNPRPIHVKDIRMSGYIHNNKMERMNGEVRDREKVMRGLKTMDTPILKGYQIYHNFLRPHEALKGETPAEKCGIQIKGENKWLTLIQNASNT